MGLTIDQIRERLKAPEKTRQIHRAVEHEERIRFHVETALNEREVGSYYRDYLRYVKDRLTKDKYNIFRDTITFPIFTNELTEDIFDSLEKIFEGKDPFFNYKFTSEEFNQDFAIYRKQDLGGQEVWRTDGWEFMKTAINSVIVVDLPEVQTASRPEPFFFWLDISLVIDYDITPKGQILWIAFKQSNHAIAVFDDENRRLFKVDDNGRLGELISESPHDLGYCPTQFFWTDNLKRVEPDLKQSPLSKQLSNLDSYLFYSKSKEDLDLYGSYPIMEFFDMDCDFEDQDTGTFCSSGVLKRDTGQYMVDAASSPTPCPICSFKRANGAGSMIQKPVPEGEDDKGLPGDAVKFTSVDVNLLKYNVDESERRRSVIFNATVGFQQEITKQAVNDRQIESSYESQQSSLENLKINFENAQEWTERTIAIERYGDDFIGLTINYGTRFYHHNMMDLHARYDAAKKSGASVFELNSLQDAIIKCEYRNNPIELERAMILSNLEPYRHQTITEVADLVDKNVIPVEKFMIKVNFANFVSRFEREQGDIVQFGSQVKFGNKIETINKEFIKYGREESPTRQNTPEE